MSASTVRNRRDRQSRHENHDHSHGKSHHLLPHKLMHSPDVIWPEAGDGFVRTPQVDELIERAFAYLDAGYPINLSGPAGTGKTTLALHLAAKLGKPMMLIHGDDEFGSSDLVGNDIGYRRNRLVDQYVHSVVKEEETMRTLWVDNRLTTACRYGHTLVYDEFTRSRPEANNVLLSVLGEEILNLPKLRYAGEGYLKVDPGFRAIFTSNPEEYAGIHKSQDALMDRLITIHVDYFDRETEVAIAAARSGVSHADAGRVVDLVRRFRERKHRPPSAQPPRGDHDRAGGRPAGRDLRRRRSGVSTRLPRRARARPHPPHAAPNSARPT